jgi:hypothetical protein
VGYVVGSSATICSFERADVRHYTERAERVKQITMAGASVGRQVRSQREPSTEVGRQGLNEAVILLGGIGFQPVRNTGKMTGWKPIPRFFHNLNGCGTDGRGVHPTNDTTTDVAFRLQIAGDSIIVWTDQRVGTVAMVSLPLSSRQH